MGFLSAKLKAKPQINSKSAELYFIGSKFEDMRVK